jgi:Flp pilus assembly protein TadD
MFEYQRAMIFDYAGKDAEALKAYETAELAGIRSAPGLIRHGRLLERLGRGGETQTLYRAFLERGAEPNVAAELSRLGSGAASASGPITPMQGAAIGLFSLASAMVGQSDPDFYMPYLTLTQMLDPNLDGAWLVYAESLRQARKYEGVRTALEKVQPSSPWYESAQVRIIWSWRDEKKDEDALAAARDFAGKSDSRLARTTLADLEREAGHFETAEALYSKLIGEVETPARSDWPLFFARGASRERLGRFAEAEADLRHALVLSPDEPDVLNYLGYSWIERGEHLQEGLAMLQRAVSLSPKAGYIIDSLGWAHFKLGDYAAALDTLERAVELSPEDSTLNDHLGDLYWRLNRKVEARFQWTRALTLDPDATEKARIEKKLTQGLPPLAAGGGVTPPRAAQ